MKSMIIKANCGVGALVGLYLLLSVMDGYVHPKMETPIYLTIGYLLFQIVFLGVEIVSAFWNEQQK